MQSSARDTYLATQVQTATPQKLHLMLIDGAIRWSETTKRLWRENKNQEASEACVRAHKILGELLASVRSDDSELARRVVSVYAYLFSTMTEALRDHDPEKIDHVLSVLKIERETWRQVCAKFGSEKAEIDDDTADPFVASETQTPEAVDASIAPEMEPPVDSGGSTTSPPGISFEA